MNRSQVFSTAHRIFKAVLGPSSPDAIFEEGRLSISDDGKRLYEFTGNDRELSETVFGMDFPRVAAPADLDHYTKVSSLRGMIATGSIHLQTVLRNVPFGEFHTYATEHDLDGYLDLGADQRPIYEELAKDLFYVSLTVPDHQDEATMWDDFADDAKGVRLRLRVTPSGGADLRRMAYQAGSRTALWTINEQLRKLVDVVFTPWSISRICGFYLTGGYRHEREVRLMIKRHKDGVDRTTTSGGYQVWPVELVAPGQVGSDPYCSVELLGIMLGSRCRKETVEAVLKGTPYAAVPVV